MFTTCFQRDSAKDEAVVFIFIGATTGLLVYAAVRPWVEKWSEVGYQTAKEDHVELTGCRVGGKEEIISPLRTRAVRTSREQSCAFVSIFKGVQREHSKIGYLILWPRRVRMDFRDITP